MRADLYRLLMSSALIQGVGLLVTVVIGIQLARYLGPVQYGIYGLILALVSIFVVIAQFGLALLGTREAARVFSPGSGLSLASLFRWFAQRTVAFAAIASLVLLLGLAIARPEWFARAPSLGLLAAAFVIVSAFASVAVAILRGLGRNLTGQQLDLLLRPALTAAMLLAVYLVAGGLTVSEALLVQIATAAIVLLLALIFLHRINVSREPADGRPFHLHGWLKTSASYASNSLLAALNGNYPILVAGMFVAGADLGVLRVAFASSVITGLPTAVANIAVIPVVAKHHAAGDREALKLVLSHTTLASFLATLAILVFLYFAGEPLIVALFGPEYAGAYFSLLLIGACNLVISAFGIAGSYFNLTNRETIVTRAFIISATAGILTSLLLAPTYGINGAAAGTVVMAAAWHAYVFGVRRRDVDMPISLWAALRHVSRPASG